MDARFAGIVLLRDIGEKASVATPPGVDGLFDVADLKERTRPRVLLNDLVD